MFSTGGMVGDGDADGVTGGMVLILVEARLVAALVAGLVAISRRKIISFLSSINTIMTNPIYFLDFLMLLTHSHTMTPFDAPGKQAF